MGLPDEDWGERVHAVVIQRDKVDAAELMERCRNELARYQVPKSIEYRDQLPMTTYGKADKKYCDSQHSHEPHDLEESKASKVRSFTKYYPLLEAVCLSKRQGSVKDNLARASTRSNQTL